MARKGPSLSSIVRDYLESHPDAPTKQIIEDLKSHKISYQLAAKVRSDWLAAKGKPARKKTKARRGRPPAKREANSIELGSLELAAEFVDRCGGVDNAQEVLSVLSRVTSATSGKKK